MIKLLEELVPALLIKQNKKRKKMAIRTFPILLKDGIEGRAVKVSAKNISNVFDWIGLGSGILAVTSPAKNVRGSEYKIKLRTIKGIRVARIGDIVVKLKDDKYMVVKADEFAKYIQI